MCKSSSSLRTLREPARTAQRSFSLSTLNNLVARPDETVTTIQLCLNAHYASRQFYNFDNEGCFFSTSVTKKEKFAAKLWEPTWGFLSKIREIQEEEAQKLGFTPEEYKNAVRSVSCHLEPKKYPVVVDPSPYPLPPTSAAIVGRRALCPLERYGRLVKTYRDYPTRPPLKPGQIYDPYKQTLVFLGSVDGDPVSYNLPISRYEVTDEMLAQPKQLSITPFDFLNNE